MELLLVEARGQQRRQRVECPPLHVGLPRRKRQRVERRADVAEGTAGAAGSAVKRMARRSRGRRAGSRCSGAMLRELLRRVVGLSRRRGSRNATRSSVARAIAVSTSMTRRASDGLGGLRKGPALSLPARSSNIRCTCAAYSLPQRRRALVVFQVQIAVRQPQRALADRRDEHASNRARRVPSPS